MSFGNIGSRWIDAQNGSNAFNTEAEQWYQRLRRLAQQRQTYAPTPMYYGGQAPGAQNYVASTTPKYSSGVINPFGGQPVTSTNTPSTTSTGTKETPKPKEQPATDGKGGGLATTAVPAGRYYSNVAIPEDLSPQAAANLWAQYNKYGGSAMAEAGTLMNDVNDPLAMMRAMGVDPRNLKGDSTTLEWLGKFWNMYSGQGTGPNLRPSGAAIVRNILNAAPIGPNTPMKPGSLSQIAGNMNYPAAQQVSNVNSLLLSALQGVINDDTYQAYKAVLDQMGNTYQTARANRNDPYKNVPYNEFLKQQLGPGGGLY